MDDDPITVRSALRSELEIAKMAFRARCRSVLRDAYAEADMLSSAIGTVSVEEAYAAWVTFLTQRLGE
jgi:hypothetical protein